MTATPEGKWKAGLDEPLFGFRGEAACRAIYVRRIRTADRLSTNFVIDDCLESRRRSVRQDQLDVASAQV